MSSADYFANATMAYATSPDAAQSLGRVTSVRGSQATVGLPQLPASASPKSRATVGSFIGIRTASTLLVGVITDVSIETAIAQERGDFASAKLELVGEIRHTAAAGSLFQRGVTEYPAIGDPVTTIGAAELKLIFNSSHESVIDVGQLQQDTSIGAYVDVDNMIGKHFAVLGSTGVGKSSGVALILNETLRTRPDLRILVLDAHNEYGRTFGDRALVLNPRNLKLPFWLFNFEEIVDVLFGGRQAFDDEVDILAEVIPLAKSSYNQYRTVADRALMRRGDPKTTGFTVDTPVPYRIAELITLLDERMGKLENRSSRMIYHKLITCIESVTNDPRYAFMFENANVGGDTMAEVLTQLYRLPPNGKPMTIIQLAGFPSEVVDAAISVICRMAFDFGVWSDGAAPLLFVFEEAHRYVAADRNIGFAPTRRAISRIAKEGRKYGVFLGLVTQRPAELDATILSQCSTIFAMRMTNERDHTLLKSAVSDTAANLLAFLPSLGTGEVFAFGEGVALPTRFAFRKLPPHQIPKSEMAGHLDDNFVASINQEFITSVLERWRGATTTRKANVEEPHHEPAAASIVPEAAPPQPAPYRPQLQSSLLKKPLV